MLGLSRNISRFLISTTSRFSGKFEHEGILIDSAFRHTDRRSLGFPLTMPPPADFYLRRYLLVSISYRASKTGGKVAKYDPNSIVDLASVWFGKRFDVHGWIEWFGHSFLPYGTDLAQPRMAELGAFNNEARKDLEIPLDLGQLTSPFELFLLDKPESSLGAFWKAASFYASSLRDHDTSAEVAFLHLISALEIIASEMVFPENTLYDAQTLSDFETIERRCSKAVAQRYKERCYQIGRKVILSAVELTNKAFFSGSESGAREYALTRERLADAVKAAYDIRSKYLHSGATFSFWLDPIPLHNNEMSLGQPALPKSQRELAQLLAKIPTFLGLERLARFMILRFAHLKIKRLHDRLD